MAVACPIDETTRPVVDLAAEQLNAVRRLEAARNVGLIADLLARRVPGLRVITDYFDDPRAACFWQAARYILT